MPDRRFDRWVVRAAATPKDPSRNQDRVVLAREDSGAADLGLGVVVCDGVGSLAGSGAVAEQAATAAADHIVAHGIRRGILGDDTVVHCAQHAADEVGAAEDGATTLLAVGADAQGFVAYNYVGNGALLDIEPVVRGSARVRLSIADLVAPHVSWAAGKPDLRSVIPPRAGHPVVAARGLLYPQPDRARLLLAVTDGIATDEDRTLSRSKQGATWQSVPEPLAALVDAIESAWPAVSAADAPGQVLEEALQERLDELAGTALVDDATVGAVLLVPVGVEHAE